jgi:hypothetical protein
MGYQGEYATYQPVRRLAHSPHLQAMLASMELPSKSLECVDTPASAIPITWVKPSDFRPKAVISVDGSLCPIKWAGGSQAVCLTVVAVHHDQSKAAALSSHQPVEPGVWQATRHIESLELALPGPKLSAFGEPPGHPSYRRALYEALDSLDLLPTYEALLSYKPRGALSQRSPYELCERQIVPRAGTWTCSCNSLHRLYSTDALRVHERL